MPDPSVGQTDRSASKPPPFYPLDIESWTKQDGRVWNACKLHPPGHGRVCDACCDTRGWR